MKNRDQKPLQGWKAVSILLGVSGFLLLATWAAVNDRDQSSVVAVTTNSDSERTVGLAPHR